MTPLAYIVALGLVLVPFTSAPAAAAAPCKETGAVTGLVDVLVHKDCTVEIVLFSGLHCLWGTSSKTVAAGPASVTYWYCTGPQDQSSAAGCPSAEAESWLLEGTRVTVGRDCGLEVVAFPHINCIGGNVGSASVRAGPATVTVYYCRGHNDPR